MDSRELPMTPLSREDEALISAANSLILKRGEYGRHHIACALRTGKGQQVIGLHISANVGVGSICAEGAAIAEAIKYEPNTIERIVSVRHTFATEHSTEIVQPCGRCREVILEYGPDAFVIMSTLGGYSLVEIARLLPLPFYRLKRDKDGTIGSKGRI